jgi:hypothetical protein
VARDIRPDLCESSRNFAVARLHRLPLDVRRACNVVPAILEAATAGVGRACPVHIGRRLVGIIGLLVVIILVILLLRLL